MRTSTKARTSARPQPTHGHTLSRPFDNLVGLSGGHVTPPARSVEPSHLVRGVSVAARCLLAVAPNIVYEKQGGDGAACDDGHKRPSPKAC
jgi:hypothetical protein